jgi:hypothetical protein
MAIKIKILMNLTSDIPKLCRRGYPKEVTMEETATSEINAAIRYRN